uniref:Uncharacterized protein n=1 Tax=Arundo donax TaxID=35708 RepID=A0A0A9FBK6_ARUDO
MNSILMRSSVFVCSLTLTESGFYMVENRWKYIGLQLAFGTWRGGIL